MKKRPAARTKRSQNASSRLRVSLVGAGAVGSTLLTKLFEQGCEVVSIVSRSGKPALALAKETQCRKVSTSLTDISADTDILLIAVPDTAMAEVVRSVASQKHLRFSRMLVVHTSGVHSTEVLKTLQRRGAAVASMHPVQSFPKSKPVRARVKSLEGIAYGVEGEAKALERVNTLVRSLGGRSVHVSKDLKPLYHAACVFASNYGIALLNAVMETCQPLEFRAQWREVMLPLFTSSVENALKSSPSEGLTGPIARGDFATVMMHLDSLQRNAPQLVPFYCAAGVETARIARTKGDLSSAQFRDLLDRLRRFIRSSAKPSKRS